jgi:hypothetical protein
VQVVGKGKESHPPAPTCKKKKDAKYYLLAALQDFL